ncbi:hypothetical protein AX17_006537 [Amanita inopinata Kibby_2008]|nr:hypothetical protein AX17_006537 [Amanita inopinata Kibby_2008]
MTSHDSLLDNISSSPQISPSPQAPPSGQKYTASASSQEQRPLAEIIGHPFQVFDHQKEVIDPFSEEEHRDETFQKELCAMLLDAIIESHAWSVARLKHESIVAAEHFDQKIARIMDVEKEQGTLSLRSPSYTPFLFGFLGNFCPPIDSFSFRVLVSLHISSIFDRENARAFE